MPFQTTATRRRKHAISKVAEEVPVCLYLFDLLYLNVESLLEMPHFERRQQLQALCGAVITKSAHLQLIHEESFDEADSAKRGIQLEEYFEQQIDAGMEGLIAKRIDAPYQAGKRNFNWIKLKRLEKSALSDTIDCVIMGYYRGRGKRASMGIGALLAGIYNTKDDLFETVCKIGTGLSDQEWASYREQCGALKVASQPANYTVAPALAPDVWVLPKIVVVVRADLISVSPLHTACKRTLGHGLALRFPRLIQLRDDKDAFQATTTDELIAMQK
jgi:DNA ligase-1